ncbi:MAG: FAD-dependent oxidoreductase [Actinomycetota bacterium]|nr:FAD-dependent oxidoreductase [Actinomycetota bacterium]
MTTSLAEAAAQHWDLLVVGGGTAGIVGARTAASFGVTVLLVESHRTGGDCLWTGCVPSKSLLAAAHTVANVRRASELGVFVGEVSVDFAAVMRHVCAAIAAIEPTDSVAALEQAGVSVLRGRARMAARRVGTEVSAGADVEVDGRRISSRQVLLATGADPSMPDLPGLRAARAWTSETIWDLDRLPERLTVVGGGSIGCELGQAFARLGSRVTLLEMAQRLLPSEDPDASAAVTAALVADGVDVRTGTGLEEVTGDVDLGSVRTSGGASIDHDGLLVALGRRPRTADLGLDEAGVGRDEHANVRVDASLRSTTNPRVWAAGDLTGHPQFTHVAGVHASTAASNAVLGLRRAAAATAVPRVTYTDPEVASVGIPTVPVDAAGHTGVEMITRQHVEVDRAITEGRTEGFARLAVDGKGRIVGATVVGPRAGETLPELVLAVRHGLRTRDLAGVMHPYPTYADGPWNAAVADVRSRLSAPAARRVTDAAVRARRRWLDLRGQRSSR